MSTPNELFEEGIRRYEAGESAESLLPLFKDLADKQPKNGPIHTCLAWLYLLNGEAQRGLKAARLATKLAPIDAQAHVNLALAMLDSKQKGVREHVERTLQILQVDGQQAEEVRKNCEEGLKRRPDWQALLKIRQWLFEA